METTCPKMSIWIVLITQLFLFYCMENSNASHVKSIHIGRPFYQKKNEGNKVKAGILMHRRSDGNTDQYQRSHNFLLIDLSNLENVDNKKDGVNSKPKLLEIDTSILSRPLHSIFPELFQSNPDFDQQFENEQYDGQNDETNEIFPLHLDHSNNDQTYYPATDTFSMGHSSHANALPYSFPYVHRNSKETSSEKTQESNQNIPLWPLEKGTGTSNHKLPKWLSTFKKNVFERKSSYY